MMFRIVRADRFDFVIFEYFDLHETSLKTSMNYLNFT